MERRSQHTLTNEYQRKFFVGRTSVKMQAATFAVSIIASLAMTPLASAATVTFTNKALWNSFTIAQGNTVNIETFEAFEDGVAKSATATAGTTTWHASATPGPFLFSHFGGNQTIGTASAGVTLNFNFTPAVKGFGAHAYGLDSGGNVVPVIVSFRLADGSSYVGYAASATDFAGFYSTGSPIASLEWSYLNPDTRLVVDDLYFAAIGSVGDIDGDGQPDTTDNCPTVANPTQADCDSNGIGDVCEIAAGVPDFNGDTVPDTCQCLADLFIDGQVNGADLGALLAFWGPVNPGLPEADLNRDGIVNGADLGYLLNAWGPCVVQVPVWATLIESQPDPAVVTDPALRAAIIATNLAWRVQDTVTHLEMLLVPPGPFQMGCANDSGTQPAHQVTLTTSFYLGRYEVTQAQWVAKMGSNPSTYQGANGFAGSDERPVDMVAWNMAQQFLAVSGFRLPTDAEWEYACRAGTTTDYYNGSNDQATLGSLAWWGNIFTGEGNSGMQTHPVGQKQPNNFGFHDMLGNVSEWTSCGSYNYSPEPVVDPACPPPGTSGTESNNAINRGGSAGGPTNTWTWHACERNDFAIWITIPEHGFRVARNP
jgi:formylglycine-generating enzyme required for sulfatase activity